ncbi:hypothetical protein Tsubulata_037278 [Turnera subulata]|uniref:BRCT domain-containing protein n=1 Tax=Turnera subulata TaxID=218843 RepID=A0A9Q0GA56_9ROSI|nr:hypothetical protein Tsubulata_037278 [Turnera subulata]
MASLGFRPPQFSEDLAWLPPWLHHHPQAQPSPSPRPESLTASGPVPKGLTFSRGNSSDVENLREERGGYNSCHLFLSGEDASERSITPSQPNVLHFRLYLSSDGDSECSQSRVLCSSEALCGSNKVKEVEDVESLAHPGGKLNESKTDVDAQAVNASPLCSGSVVKENVVSQLPTSHGDEARQSEENLDHNDDGLHVQSTSFVPATGTEDLQLDNADLRPANDFKDHESQCEEKSKLRHVKDVDVYDAIELSVAASEALVIHELIKEGSASEAVPAKAILDAALHLKRARLEVLEDSFSYLSDEIDGIDCLSDLDDLYMEDAFLDVGLSLSGHEDRNVQGSDVSKVEDTPVLHTQCVDKDPRDQEDVIVDHPALGFISNGGCLVGSVSPADCPAMETSHAFHNVQISLPHILAERFRSRWLGGWKVEETDAPAKFNNDRAKSIPHFFVGETSFLSESADIASDENSVVQKNESRCEIVSQSSIPFSGLHDKADEELLTEEIRSSNLAFVDPLCSVVPCSLSSESAGSPLPQNEGNKVVDDGNYVGHASELERGSLRRPPYLYVESQAPVRRQVGLLKNYSMCLPKRDAILDSDRLCDNRLVSSKCCTDLLSACQDMSCIRSSNQNNSKGLLPSIFAFENTSGGVNKENQGAVTVKNQVPETSNQMSNCDQPTKDEAEMHVLPLVPRRSPVILNRRLRCRLQPSALLANNLSIEKASKLSLEEANNFDDNLSKNSEKIQSIPQYLNTQKPVRKRVSFSEVEVELQGNKEIKTPKTTNRSRSSVRANKRLKHSSPWLDAQSEDVKKSFAGYMKEVKKLIFHGIEFLITGFSSKKEKEIIGQIQECGGVVLVDIPSPPSCSRAKRISRATLQLLPIVISLRKLQTSKFLYGCAVNAFILKAKWLSDSIAAGSILPPEKYMLISNRADLRNIRVGKPVCLDERIFHGVGIVLHGKHSFCTKLAVIIKHGGGQVFKTLQRLFQSLDAERISTGAIVAEDWGRALRHLRFCASERKIPMMSASWIAKSLHSGTLLPFKGKTDASGTTKESKLASYRDWSEEI